ncbi:MAG: DNA-directed RNA polymerase subunit delta [Candidatus Izemoplasmatales bacterium]
MTDRKNMSIMELANLILKENNKAMTFMEIYDRIVEEKEISETDKLEMISQVYADFILSAKFIYVGDDEWDIKGRQTIDLWDKDGAYYDEYPDYEEELSAYDDLDDVELDDEEEVDVEEDEEEVDVYEKDYDVEDIEDDVDDLDDEELDDEFIEDFSDDDDESLFDEFEEEDESIEINEEEDEDFTYDIEEDDFDDQEYNEYMDDYEKMYDE